MAGGGVVAEAGAGAMPGVLGQIAPPIAADRVRYLRKVYALLGASSFVAVACGWLAVSVGPTISMTSPEGHPAEVPLLVGLMLGNDVLLYGAFGLLVVATFVASWVSKVRYVNIAALFGVAALMKKLTVVSVIFLPLTFLCGVYGMNFRVLPELEWHYGYVAFWILVLIVVAAIGIVSRRARLL